MEMYQNDQDKSADTEKSQTDQSIKKSLDWILVHYYVADSLELVGSYEDASKYIVAVQSLSDDMSKSSKLTLQVFKSDKFTDIKLSSLYWELYLRLAKANKQTQDILCALLKLIKVKEKPTIERDSYRLEIADIYEKENNPQMAIKYYQILLTKGEEPEVRQKAKRKLNELLNDAETRSANASQARRRRIEDEKNETTSARSFRLGAKSVGKSGASNCIIFTPSSKAKKGVEYSREELHDSKSIAPSTDDSRSEHQKLVFRQRTPPRATPKPESPNKEFHIPLAHLSSEVSETSSRSSKDSFSNMNSDRSSRTTKTDGLTYSRPAKAEKRPDTHRGNYIPEKVSMIKADKQPSQVTAEKISKSRPGIVQTKNRPATAIQPKKELTSPTRVVNGKAANSNLKKNDDSGHKKSNSKVLEEKDARLKIVKDKKKELSSAQKKPYVVSLPPDTSTSSQKIPSQKSIILPRNSGALKRSKAGPNVIGNIPQKKSAVDIPKKIPHKQKDILNSPEMKTSLRAFDVSQFRFDETFGQEYKLHAKEKPEDELQLSIESFLIRILGLTDDQKFEEAESFLQKYKVILETSNKDGSQLPEQAAFEKFLKSRVQVFQGKLSEAEKSLTTALDLYSTTENYIEKLPPSKLYSEMADLYKKQGLLLKALEVHCTYLCKYNSIDTDGTLIAIRHLFSTIELVNSQVFERMSIQKGGEVQAQNQLFIIKKLEEVEHLPFMSIKAPVKALTDKRLEAMVVLSSAYFVAQQVRILLTAGQKGRRHTREVLLRDRVNRQRQHQPHEGYIRYATGCE